MSVLVGALSFYIRAARWRILLLGLGKPVKRIDTFNGVGIAYLTNFALPRAGEVARCGVVARRTGLAFDKVLGTVVLERTFDMFCLLVITIVVGFLRMDVFGEFLVHQIWAPFSALVKNNTVAALILVVGVPLVFAVLWWIFREYIKTFKITDKITDFSKACVTEWYKASGCLRKACFCCLPFLCGFFLYAPATAPF